MWMPRLHAAVDDLAMWSEDRRRLPPVPFRAAAPAPLDCFGPLPPLPTPPGGPGAWEAPSPRPTPGDGRLLVEVAPARGPRRGTAVLVPPWKLSRLSMVSGWADLLAGAGLDVWTLIPPRHLSRAAPGTRSGDGFVTPDVPALRTAVEQLVVEVRLLLALARARGGEVALLGLSLGGLAAALAATSPEAADRTALVAPPADLAAVVTETRIGRRFLALSRRAGGPAPAAGELGAMLLPFRADGRRPTTGRVLVAVGDSDRIALPAGGAALAAAWGAELHAYRRGHLTLLFACRALRRDVRRFLG